MLLVLDDGWQGLQCPCAASAAVTSEEQSGLPRVTCSPHRLCGLSLSASSLSAPSLQTVAQQGQSSVQIDDDSQRREGDSDEEQHTGDEEGDAEGAEESEREEVDEGPPPAKRPRRQAQAIEMVHLTAHQQLRTHTHTRCLTR